MYSYLVDYCANKGLPGDVAKDVIIIMMVDWNTSLHQKVKEVESEV